MAPLVCTTTRRKRPDGAGRWTVAKVVVVDALIEVVGVAEAARVVDAVVGPEPATVVAAAESFADAMFTGVGAMVVAVVVAVVADVVVAAVVAAVVLMADVVVEAMVVVAAVVVVAARVVVVSTVVVVEQNRITTQPSCALTGAFMAKTPTAARDSAAKSARAHG